MSCIDNKNGNVSICYTCTNSVDCMNTNCKNTNRNVAICNTCDKKGHNCENYNRNVALNKVILEKPCEKSETKYNPEAIVIKCKKDKCEEYATCKKVLSPKMAVNDRPLEYSEYSGYTSVLSPNYITLDLGEITEIQTIQFLLWDNRGYNNKRDYCDREHHYRLLISDYPEDLECDDSGNIHPKRTDNDSQIKPLAWKVVYDSLRIGYNGWQVFNFSEKAKIRYIRLHMISNTDGKRNNLVRIEAYKEKLEGYEYNFLPTFETVIHLNYRNRNISKTQDVTNKCYLRWLNKSVNWFKSIFTYNPEYIDQDPINKLTKAISKHLDNQVANFNGLGSTELATELMLFNNDLNFAVKELELYEDQVIEMKNRVFHNANTKFKISNRIKWFAIFASIICSIISAFI